MNDSERRVHEHRTRVSDDTFELIATLETWQPLLESNFAFDTDHVPKLLRRVLARYIILMLTRLLARPQNGQTGETASLKTLLALGREVGKLSDEFVQRELEKLSAIENGAAGDGLDLADLIKMRHTEIAHTLIPHKPAQNQIWAFAVTDAAMNVIESAQLTLAQFENDDRYPAITNNRNASHEWEEYAALFWKPLPRQGLFGRLKKWLCRSTFCAFRGSSA